VSPHRIAAKWIAEPELVPACPPVGRLDTGEEIATAALFLASSDSSFVTGIDLSVDGASGRCV
jgi:NAD(P)-dependent dehydrogenase (short-subunit alcohol dehydrogenase family)